LLSFEESDFDAIYCEIFAGQPECEQQDSGEYVGLLFSDSAEQFVDQQWDQFEQGLVDIQRLHGSTNEMELSSLGSQNLTGRLICCTAVEF